MKTNPLGEKLLIGNKHEILSRHYERQCLHS